MIQTFFKSFLYYSVKSSLIVSGPGANLFQREKSEIKFRILETSLLCVSLIICLFVSYFANKYISTDEVYINLKFPIYVIIVALFQLVSMKVFSLFSNYNYYIYNKSISFVTDFVFILFILFSANFDKIIADFTIDAIAIVLSVFLSSMIFGFFVDEINKSSVLKVYSNVPARLFILAIISILLNYLAVVI